MPFPLTPSARQSRRSVCTAFRAWYPQFFSPSRRRECDFTATGESTVPATTSSPSLADLQAKSKTIRKEIITSTATAGSGHPTSSLSGVEVAVALYFGGVLRHDAKNPHWPQRDRFIVSKGHGAPLLYAVLAEAGYFPVEALATLRKLGSPLEGHANM